MQGMYLVKFEFEMIILWRGEKPENLEKNPWSKARTNNKLSSLQCIALGQNQTKATLVGQALTPRALHYL